jgi:ribonucleoside-diphosphate reductase alpha chain
LFETDFARNIYEARYKHPQDGNWTGTARRVGHSVMGALYAPARGRVDPGSIIDATDRVISLFERRQAVPGGRYLYAAGRDLHQVNNCILLRCPDTREGWAETSYQAEMSLMTGAGIGVWYGDLRGAGSLISRTGGLASGPIPKMSMINDMGRYVMQGGARRSAIWAGLPWWHPDIFEFITAKDYSDEVKALKAKDWTFPAPMDTTNISVTLDDDFFWAYDFGQNETEPKIRGRTEAPDGGRWSDWARRVYDAALGHMLRHGEPGFTVDVGENAGEVLRNACTEITSADDSDVCNLGSLVLSRFSDPQQFGAAVRDMALFLTAGSLYSDVPYEKVREVRDSNRRLGLGLIGVHEFLMQRGIRYGTDEAFEVLEPYMVRYARALEFAWDWQDRLGLSRSKGATAIAPNGTIGIVAESTPSADPLLCAAEIRDVKVAQVHGSDLFEPHVVVDPTAARLRAQGVDTDLIEDAYTIDAERRIRQQHFLQTYVDHSISSTVNINAPITEPSGVRSFGETLMKYLPGLRGITVYPDGARAGQPRKPVDLAWALEQGNAELESDENTCIGGVCSI